MGKTKKQNTKIVKPYAEWAVRNHLIEQARIKGILESTWQEVVKGEIELTKVRKHDDKCEKCRHFKFDFFPKVAPTDKHDIKIIGCQNCEVFITVYLNERTHGNTPIHPYQIAQGMTEYIKVCARCGKRTKITTEHKTSEQVEQAMKHECR